MISQPKIAVLGAGNVGVAISADLSLLGYNVLLVKTSSIPSRAYDLIQENNNKVILKEGGVYKPSTISEVTTDLSVIRDCDVVFVAIQSTYHESLIRRISKYLKRNQIVVVICGYMASFYFLKMCSNLPAIVETTGPYLEGRIDLEDKKDDIVFRVGCRLTRSPLSVFRPEDLDYSMSILQRFNSGFAPDYSTIESALLNPNMVLHTVGAIMSIPRIEYSHGNFCMYREAYTRDNKATMKIMLGLDNEKKEVLKRLGCRPIDIFKASGFLGDPFESFYRYSESSNRAISPTSVHSRYITEDVSQGLVLLESIATKFNMPVPITSSLITLASQALDVDFRETGRTIEKLEAEDYILNFIQNDTSRI